MVDSFIPGYRLGRELSRSRDVVLVEAYCESAPHERRLAKIPRAVTLVDRQLSHAFVAAHRYFKLLSHAALAKVYECDVIGQQPFAIVEFLSGAPLKERLGARINVDVVARSLLDALDYCHRHRAVVQNLSPASIFLDTNDQVRLGNFEYARCPGNTPSARSGFFWGNVAYAAPEQVSYYATAAPNPVGGGEPPGPQADIYAWGRIVGGLLSGAWPSADTSDDGVPRRWAEPLSPPGPLGPVVSKATQVDVAQRWKSVAEIRASWPT